MAIRSVWSGWLGNCLAALACLCAIFLTALLTRIYAAEDSPILIASMGASAVILFAIPGSPLAQPWPFIGGQMLSALMGVCAARYVPDTALAAALAVGSAVLLMQMLRCLHPPGAATALAPVLGGGDAAPAPLPDFGFLLVPVGVNVLCMLIIALLINRLLLRRYHSANTQPPDQAVPAGMAALKCADIMRRDIVSVEYATQVKTAWRLMQKQRLNMLPVVDNTGRIIGIVTRHDFYKNPQPPPGRQTPKKPPKPGKRRPPPKL
ncbi:MAG: HPP family protein [Methylococcales bacterium]|nr:HPP family protein [Methylococcales bacterium]